MKNASIHVYIVTDQPLIALGFSGLAGSSDREIRVAGSTTACSLALRQLDKCKADLTLLDLDLSTEAAVDSIPELRKKTRILAYTGACDVALQDKAILLGARGVVDKRAGADTLLVAIRRVHEGQIWLDRAATGRIFVEFSRGSLRGDDNGQEKIETLTERERQIVRAAATHAGANAKKIAAVLNISESTLRNHLTSIYAKLGLANRLELFAYLQKHDVGSRPR